MLKGYIEEEHWLIQAIIIAHPFCSQFGNKAKDITSWSAVYTM